MTTAAVSARATASAAATGTLFPWARNIHRQGTSTQILSVQSINRLLRLFRRAHRYEPEPTRAGCDPIRGDISLDDRPVRRKSVLQLVFGDLKVEIPNE